MNIIAWTITVLLGLVTFSNVINTPLKCPCRITPIATKNNPELTCHKGKLYSTKDSSYATSHGDCPPTDFLASYLACLTSGQCLEYIVSALKFLLVLSLPFVLDHQSRLVAHAIINCIASEGGNLKLGSQSSLALLMFVLLGTYIFQWELRNGDGFLGPVVRARTGKGRFA